MNERYDSKLLLLRMIRGWYKILIGAVVGALLIGIPYVFVNVLLADEPDYRMRVTMHVEYAEDSAGNVLDYINEYTWGEWVDSDIYIDEVSKIINLPITKDSLRSYIDATLETDARLVEIDVTTKDPMLTQTIADAVAALSDVFVVNAVEIAGASIVFEDECALEVDRDIRVPNAFILGAVIGFVLALFIMAVVYVMDDSVYIPLLFKNRYSIPIVCDYEDKPSDERATVLYIGKSLDAFPEKFVDNKVILEIESGAHNGKLLEDVIYELEDNGINIVKAVIKNADKKLIKAYMASTKFPNPFIKE